MTTNPPLPYLTNTIPGIGGTIKNNPEDFVVEEIPLYPPAGSGDHLYLWIEKTGISTFAAIQELAQHLNTKPRNFGYAGLKDAHARTLQYVSIEHTNPQQFADFNSAHLTIKHSSLHPNKLRTGHLTGNHFKLRITDLDNAANAYDACSQIMHTLAQQGCPNYYTEQRFGADGKNALYGKALLDLLNNKISDSPVASEQFLNRHNKKIKQLWLSSVQSQLFNEILAKRIQQNTLSTLFTGDLAYLHRNGAVFEVTDLAAEQARCQNFELSPSGPILGYKMISPTGQSASQEQEIFTQHQLTKNDFHCGQGLSQKGARRPLRFQLSNTKHSLETDTITLEFSLPKGCYATAILREINKPT